MKVTDELSEDEFDERLSKYAGDSGGIRGPENVKGFSTALFKRKQKHVPSKKALRMLKITRDPEIFQM